MILYFRAGMTVGLRIKAYCLCKLVMPTRDGFDFGGDLVKHSIAKPPCFYCSTASLQDKPVTGSIS